MRTHWYRIGALSALFAATPLVLKALQFGRPSAPVSIVPAVIAVLALIVFVCVVKMPRLGAWTAAQAGGFGAVAVMYAVLFAQICFAGAALSLTAPQQYAFFTMTMYSLLLVFLWLAFVQVEGVLKYRRTWVFSVVLASAATVIGLLLLRLEAAVHAVQTRVLLDVAGARLVHVPGVGDLVSIGAVNVSLPAVMVLTVLAGLAALMTVLWKHHALSPVKTVGFVLGVPFSWLVVQTAYELMVILVAKNSAAVVSVLLDPLVLWVLLALYVVFSARLLR